LSTYDHPTIVIQGGGNGLGIARNLGQQGIDVYCVTSDRSDPAIFSKYCTGSMVVPGIETHPDTLKRSLQRLGTTLPHKGVIFPTGDLSVLTLSSLIHELDHYISFIPEKSIVETFVLKKQFYQSLRDHGVPHPRTLNPDDVTFDTIGRQLSLPVFIRPSHSRIFERTFRVPKGFIANTVSDVRGYLRLAEQHDIEVMLQEIIPGPTSNGYVIKGYFDQRSEPVILLASQKIRQPTLFSNACVFKSIPISYLAEFTDVYAPGNKCTKHGRQLRP
jgi:predicted ATP-grasp superfamily ATP-dependent carboligase